MCIVRYTAIVYSKSNRVDTLVMHSKYTPRILHNSKTRVHRVEYTLWIILIWHCVILKVWVSPTLLSDLSLDDIESANSTTDGRDY